jgi:hypothetical protein
MLPLPCVATLDAERRDGQKCVWCSGDPSVSLGPRIGVVRGYLERFQPRACLSCVTGEAARVYGIHRRNCRRCGGATYCPDGRALYALAHQTGETDEQRHPASTERPQLLLGGTPEDTRALH